MPFTFTRTTTLTDGTDKVIGTTGIATDDARLGYDGTVAASSEPQIQLAFDMDDVTAVGLLASGPITLYQNDLHSGSPAGTPIALTAGREVVWLTGDVAPMPFDANVTSLYARNQELTSSTLKIRILKNSI